MKQENKELSNAVKLLHTALATIRDAMPAEIKIQTESSTPFRLTQYKSFKEMVESSSVGPWTPPNSSRATVELSFYEKARNEVGLCVICPQCGGSSASFCQCAREKYISNGL